MRNDAGLHACSPRGGSSRGRFFPSSFRAISSYLRSVSANASSIASTVRSAGASVASTVSLAEDERQREQVRRELCGFLSASLSKCSFLWSWYARTVSSLAIPPWTPVFGTVCVKLSAGRSRMSWWSLRTSLCITSVTPAPFLLVVSPCVFHCKQTR